MFFTGYGPVEFFVDLPVTGINAAITDRFIMLFRDVADKTLYEFHNGNRFFHILIIFMTVVMEGDKVAVIFINPGGGNDGTAKVASDVFDDRLRFTFIGFGIYVEPFLVFPVAAGFDFFKGGANPGFHFIEQGGTEGVTEECIVKVIDVAPKPIITVSPFRNEAVDVRIPF